MNLWTEWAGKGGDKLLDRGAPLGLAIIIKADSTVDNGTDPICGYSIIQAENENDAVELVNGYPHLSWRLESCEVKIQEMMSM
ncbi:MAG: hypothetical protein J4F31_10410 [Flavobacteriales bacterium]|nr:hypothetical protein [Flavobacteriales bacterium]